ncbi:TRAP transporter, 4TM/12TM fusion protein [uncultured Alphaproteobacteria bacterium]|uniref:TRAP transporter, 4TM/12TM fusion protein n=1 Tax=uncultured Alphaproteobacteria bacterium TaxID=91750 RepID=A0A212KCZ6_9PROT|nr:TRAP transporter, 4TM/12TM fusion protein [uncultured Alphaproteobacteria bacterium]
MSNTDTSKPEAHAVDAEALQDLVTAVDMGGRKPTGLTAKLMMAIAFSWSMFQLWYASPLPFMLNIGVITDGIARSIHLAFAIFLAALSYPAFVRSPRDRVPLSDWLLGIAGACATLYLVVFYRDLALRPGLPTTTDVVVSVVGVVVLLEMARRAVGPAIMVIAIVMLGYIFAGPHLPGMIAHKGASLSRVASQMWLTSEGIFGVALGVSTNVVFMFVLFGTLLEKAGAGGYFIQLAFSILGGFRGGPAKAGVVASGLTGMISGSSIANVVTTGTFTIPLMKRVGYSPVKAGAIECAAGVNGQIMPPVMGAAAFLIAEYVGISYAEVVKHAFFPALLTYGSLFYIVDIEAMKMGLKGLPTSRRGTLLNAALRTLMGFAGAIVLAGVIYYAIGWVKVVFGAAASPIIAVAVAVAYVALIAYRAKFPDMPLDDPNTGFVKVPEFQATARTGLHFILPVVVLIWSLMVEELSPGLSGFWGTVTLVLLIITQRPLTAWFRGRREILGREFRAGLVDLFEGLVSGARNMTTVGIATSTAGIVVGTVLLTGIGLVMTEVVELVSGGSLVIMLLLTAVICIILGMGMPTTAAYVVVATLMAPVVVDIAAKNDLALPLVAVHLFVFYFGLMADVTPPVGLAAYAAAAISGGDPVKTGAQGFRYEIRTALLPFIFIFNHRLLMIDIDGPVEFVIMVGSSVAAMVAFVGATQHWLLVRNRIYETAALVLICFTLFRPGFWLDMISPPYTLEPASILIAEAQATPPGGSLHVRFSSVNPLGEEVEKLVRIKVGEGTTGQQKLASAGLNVSALGDMVTVTTVRLGSLPNKFGIQAGDSVVAVAKPTDRPAREWFMLPALALLGLIFFAQMRRKKRLAAEGLPLTGRV